MRKTSQTFFEIALISVLKAETPNGEKILRKRLLEKYGTTIGESIQEWHKIDDILFEQFAKGASKIKNKYIAKISEPNPFQKENNKNIVDDPIVANEILKLYGDGDSRKLIDYFTSHNCLIEEVVSKTGIPQTSAYRKISKMIQTGVILESGYNISKLRKKTKTYTTPFESLRLDIEKSSVIVHFVPKNQMTVELA